MERALFGIWLLAIVSGAIAGVTMMAILTGLRAEPAPAYLFCPAPPRCERESPAELRRQLVDAARSVGWTCGPGRL